MKKILLILSLFISISVFAQQKPYVILISFDGFRWDYANRGITPNLDYIKEQGVSAVSLRPDFPSKTFPNHYSIITGMYPENHGLVANSFYDPYSKQTYKIGDSTQVTDGRWYQGEAFWQTADRNGIITASYFWPGSTIRPSYRRPDYTEKYEHSRPFTARVNGVLNWLKLPQNKRPHFITLYFEATDDMGHKYGPDSKEVNAAVAKEDSMIGLLTSRLKEISLLDSTDIIIVSDHGMTDISDKKIINVEKMLGAYKVRIQESGPFMMVQPGRDELNEVYNILQKNEKHYRVYKKDDVPACYHFSNNPFISDIVLIADLGWSLVDNRSEKYMMKYGNLGNHGYDNFAMDMNGIFFAIGPHFKSGYRTGTVNNIDIYPLLCKIFNIVPRSNIDGKLENIEYVLKEY